MTKAVLSINVRTMNEPVHNTKDLEFEVLGFRVRFKEEDDAQQDEVQKVVSLVQKEADIIKEKFPELNRGQVAVLIALKMAKDLVHLDSEYRENIEKIQTSASDALNFIAGVSTGVN